MFIQNTFTLCSFIYFSLVGFQVVATISISFIVISTVALCLNTMPALMEVDEKGNIKETHRTKSTKTKLCIENPRNSREKIHKIERKKIREIFTFSITISLIKAQLLRLENVNCEHCTLNWGFVYFCSVYTVSRANIFLLQK